MTSDRLKTLQRLAGEVPEDLAIVELGVNRGESIRHLAIGSAQGNGPTVYGVDLWGWSTGELDRVQKKRQRRGFASDEPRKVAEAEIARVGVADVVLIQGATHEIAKAWSRPIGLLYIDAAHDEASVAQDFNDWIGFVQPGGWVAFDDAEPGEKVNRVLETVVRQADVLEELQRADIKGRLAFARRRE